MVASPNMFVFVTAAVVQSRLHERCSFIVLFRVILRANFPSSDPDDASVLSHTCHALVAETGTHL